MTFARTVTVKPPWRKGTYSRRAAALKQTATPDTPCARCGLTLAQHEPHRSGRPATWDAGHQGDPPPGLPQAEYDRWPLALEASTCNRHHGGRVGLQRMRRNRRNPLDW